MRPNVIGLCLLFLVFGPEGLRAQTAVSTAGGSTNVVPLFTGGASIGNSAITQSGGNIGIGTSSPNTQLHLDDPTSAGPQITLSAFSGGVPGIIFRPFQSPSNWGNPAQAAITATDANWSANIHFYTKAPGALGNSLVERVTIQNDGNVGIGTTTPIATLNVASGPISTGSQVVNALVLQPSGGSAYGANGTSILLNSVTNYWNPSTSTNINPVAGIWSSLGVGGDGGLNYNGSLVFGSTHQGSTSPAEGMRLDPNGNVGVGTTAPGARLELNGSMKLTAGSGASITFSDSTVQSTAWNGTTVGGDYAESVDVVGEKSSYEPGDLLVLDREHPGDFLKSDKPFSRLVAGVYSTKPGLTGHRHATNSPTASAEIPMAMVGIVPLKVTTENGPIEIGDLLVSSSLHGHAMSAGDGNVPAGTVIGKSMGVLKTGTGMIEALISLQ